MEAAADRIMYGPTEARQPMGRSGRILAKRLGIDAMRLNCSLRANYARIYNDYLKGDRNMTTTYTDYKAIQKTARDAAVKAHITGKTVRDLVLDPVVTFTAETPTEKAHAFRYTVDALRVATDEQKKTVRHACEVIALNVAYVAQELRKDDGAPKVHRREVVERLKEVANALNLGVGAVNKDAALLVEWCTRAKTEGRTTDTAISANVWRQVQKLFSNKLNAHEARLKVGKDFVRAANEPAVEPAATPAA